VLLSGHRHYLQVIEGPKEPVEDTFLRIVTDDRHRDLLLLSRRMVTKREFGEWRMAHYEEAAQYMDVVRQVANLVSAGPRKVQAAFVEIMATDFEAFRSQISQ
jgi:hypothetical protein